MQSFRDQFQFNCSFCKLSLNEYYYTPFILCSQGHYSCQSCLQKQTSYEFDCPICKQKIQKSWIKNAKWIVQLSQNIEHINFMLKQKDPIQKSIDQDLKSVIQIKEYFSSQLDEENQLLNELQAYGIIARTMQTEQFRQKKQKVIAMVRQQLPRGVDRSDLNKAVNEKKKTQEQLIKMLQIKQDDKAVLTNIKDAIEMTAIDNQRYKRFIEEYEEKHIQKRTEIWNENNEAALHGKSEGRFQL